VLVWGINERMVIVGVLVLAGDVAMPGAGWHWCGEQWVIVDSLSARNHMCDG
jgi:hypothetical protein